jgi:DHA1 family bicyclomycin/chloramphenicol resistance-like MFS transporter
VKRPPVWLLVLITASSSLAFNIIVPSIPGLVVHFRSDLSTVQLTLSLYLVTLAAAQLFVGPLSDRYGRRPVLLSGLVLYSAAGLACAAAPTVETLILARIVQALGASVGFTLGRAMVRDVYGREQAATALGYIAGSVSIVPALTPALGGYLEVWFGWRASFLSVFGAGSLVLLLSYLRGYETNLSPLAGGWGAMVTSWRGLLVSRVFLGYSINVAGGSAAFFAFVTGSPALMSDVLGKPPNEFGLWFIGVSGSYMLGSLLTARLTPRFGLERMNFVGSVVTLLGAASLVAVGLSGQLSPGLLFPPMWVLAFGNGLSQANATAGAVSANPRIAGAASGVLGALQMGMGALGTAIVGLLDVSSVLPMAGAMLGFALLSLAALALTRK